MPKLAANLTMMFNEWEFLKRFKEASNSGFRGVEYLFPYEFNKKWIRRLRRNKKLIRIS